MFERRFACALLFLIAAASVPALPSLGAPPATQPAADIALLRQSATQARGIHQGCVLWSQGQGGAFPTSIGPLFEGNYFTPEYAISPQERGKQLPGEFKGWPQDQQSKWLNENTSYVILPGLTDDTDDKKIAVFEKRHAPDLEKVPVVYNDNHVEILPTDEADRRIQKQTGRSLDDWSGVATYERGDKLYLDSKLEAAIKTYRAALAKEPRHPRAPEALYLIGRAYEGLKKNDEAVKSYQELVKSYPDAPAAPLAKKKIEELGKGDGQ